MTTFLVLLEGSATASTTARSSKWVQRISHSLPLLRIYCYWASYNIEIFFELAEKCELSRWVQVGDNGSIYGLVWL